MARISIADAKAYFVGKGYSDVAASAIVGGLKIESGLNTGALNPGDGRDGSNSIGIAQWNGARAQGLQSYASSLGLAANDPAAQLGYVDYELRNTEGRAFSALQSATTPQEATAAFLHYERPGGYSSSNPTGAYTYGSRLLATNEVAGTTAGQAPVGTASTNVNAPGYYAPSELTAIDTNKDGDASWNEIKEYRSKNPVTPSAGGVNGSTGEQYVTSFDSEIGQAVGINMTQATLAAGQAQASATAAASSASIQAASSLVSGFQSSLFDSIKDYFGRFIFIILGIAIVVMGLYFMFGRNMTPVGMITKAAKGN